MSAAARIRYQGSSVNSSLRRLNLAAWTKVDPNSRETVPLADLGAGSGWRFTINGGWSSTDVFSGGIIYYNPNPLVDVTGARLTGTKQFMRRVQVVERGAPPLTSDIFFAYGVLNRIPTDATVDGCYCGMQWTGSNRNGRRGSCTNRVGSLATAGTGSSTIRGIIAQITRQGKGATSRLFTPIQPGPAMLAGDGTITGVGPGSTNSGVTITDETSFYEFVCLTRLAATDVTARPLAIDLYEVPDVGWDLVS